MGSAGAQSQDVVFAGFAYSGDAATKEARFPFSTRYEKALGGSGQTAYQRIAALIAKNPPKGFALSSGIDNLKGRAQAIVSALVITSETVSVEQFGAVSKLLVLVGGQAMFFDFKSQTVLRTYPLQFAYIDTFTHPPTDEELYDRVQKVYDGAMSKPGIFERYATALAGATLPTQVSRYLQVKSVSLEPAVLAAMPDALKRTPAAADGWAADIVALALSSRLGVPLLPYAESYAVNNVMTVQVSDGEVYNLKLPTPDYPITVALTNLRKVPFGSAPSGASYVYGAYASIKIEEPVGAKVFLNTSFKNGEVKVVPVTQTYVDDFPAYVDSVNGLFRKLADAIAGKDIDWAKSAAAAPDIEKQLSATRELVKSCK